MAKSLRFTTVLGDWSDDGHGKTSTAEVEVISMGELELTEELLRENYLANVKKLGFGLPELWDDYEQSTLRLSHFEALQRELGAIYLVCPYDEAEAEEIAEFARVYSEVELQRVEIFPADSPFGTFPVTVGSYDLYSEDALEIAMFITLAGLEGVSWSRVKKPTYLFGTYGSLLVANDQVGYGLFS